MLEHYNKDYRENIEYFSKLLNESKIEILINNKRYENKRYFIPEKEGIYTIKLIFKDIINTCQYMFTNCSKITNIILSSFDTKNCTNMSGMFLRCSKLTNINLSSFDTTKVTDMSYMFLGCENLTDINLSSFDTKNVIDMNYMFYKCFYLSNIDLNSFDTKNVNDIRGIFDECLNLKTIKINKNIFNTNFKEKINNKIKIIE